MALSWTSPLLSSPNRLHSSTTTIISKSQTLIMDMVPEPPSVKRPTCPSCSKPTRICLCNRFKTPILNNSISVTILQHSLEKKHPLNSARIAKLGLKNADVVTVSDVNSQASFRIAKIGGVCLAENGVHHLFDEMPRKRRNFDGCVKTSDLDSIITRDCVDVVVEPYGGINSFSHSEMPNVKNFDELLSSFVDSDVRKKSFMVKKVCVAGKEYGDSEEFDITVPPGSALLFPSDESVDVEDVDFEVKNLIVLDGTWAKAKRMYNENPWLKMLPHIRLDIEKVSLYREVRNQPKAGYLSTIESIVYALKALGEDSSEGLDGLLHVFESMVGDQRRCKDERLSKQSKPSASD